MHPQLFTVFGIEFPSYFVLLLTGFLFATLVGAFWARRIGENPDVIIDLGLAMLITGVVGARLLHVVADGYFWDYVHLCTDPSKVDWKVTANECQSAAYGGVWDMTKGVCHPRETDCWAWARFWSGGLTYYGGFLGATFGAWFLLKQDNFSFWKAGDMAGFAIPLGLSFGRMGCLLASCCFGVRTQGALGLVFPAHSYVSEGQFKAGMLSSASQLPFPVHPTQIYESVASLAISMMCMFWVHPRKRYDGQVLIAFVALYALARFALEFWRNDDRGGLVGLSTSQLIGLFLIGLCVAVHALRSQGRLSVRTE